MTTNEIRSIPDPRLRAMYLKRRRGELIARFVGNSERIIALAAQLEKQHAASYTSKP